MTKHVDFLGVLYLVWGGLSMLIGSASFALSLAAALIITAAEPVHEGGAAAAGITAATFTAIGAMALFWGALHAACGFGLRRCRAWSRGLALALGAVNLLLLPFGTALGVYAIWVLLHDESRQLLQPVRV